MDHVSFGVTGLKALRACVGGAIAGSPAAAPLRPRPGTWARNKAGRIPFPGHRLDPGFNFFTAASVPSLTLSLEEAAAFDEPSIPQLRPRFCSRRTMDKRPKTEKIMKGDALFPVRCDWAIS